MLTRANVKTVNGSQAQDRGSSDIFFQRPLFPSAVRPQPQTREHYLHNIIFSRIARREDFAHTSSSVWVCFCKVIMIYEEAGDWPIAKINLGH